ncbi:MAG: hypothetical protein ACFCUQ_15520 [Kiloniellales bacterium]
MATDYEQLQGHIIQCAVRSIPRGFLEDFQRRTEHVYKELFQEVLTDPAILPEQRPAKLIDNRFYRMEWELAQAAKAHGLNVTSHPIPENGWSYTYVTAGDFGLTQSYTKDHGALPQPAKFLEALAMRAGVPRLPIDEPEEIFQLKKFYALFAHTPMGKRFDEDHQKLGSLQLCVPCREMNAWGFELGTAELLSHYPAAIESGKIAPTRRATPQWRTGTEGE